MSYDEDYVNEIVNVKDKSNNYLMKKYKNSLDYEKLNSADYLNYKLKEKITNFLIPLNLNSTIIEKIFLLTKKLKYKIKENKLIPIVSYVVIQENDLNIPHNDLLKKLKLKKAWYIKYAKFIKNNGERINEISNLKNDERKKNEAKYDKLSTNEIQNLKESIEKNTEKKADAIDLDVNSTQERNFSKKINIECHSDKIHEIDKSQNLFSEIQKNFFLDKNSIKDSSQIGSINHESSDIIREAETPKKYTYLNYEDLSDNNPKNLDKSYELNLEKNQLKQILTNYIFRLKEYIKINSAEIKNYFIYDLGENAKKHKNYSFNNINIEDKIDSVCQTIFSNQKYSTGEYETKDSKENNESEILLNKKAFNINEQGMSFDYFEKIDQILNISKNIIDNKYLILRNFRINRNHLCISLIRYLLEKFGLKIKLDIFKKLFDINTSSISKTCKLFKEKNLVLI